MSIEDENKNPSTGEENATPVESKDEKIDPVTGGTTPSGDENSKSLVKVENIKKTKEEEKAEKAEWKEKRRIHNAKKCYRGRFFKNLIIYIVGFITAISVIVGGVFVAIKFIPLKTYVGGNETTQEKSILDLSLLDAVLSIQYMTIGDVPAISDVFTGLADDPDIGKFITVDEDALNKTKIVDIATIFEKCITIDTDNITVNELIPMTENNADMFNVLSDATGIEKGKITVGDLKNFNISNVQFKSVIKTEPTNQVLKTLWKDASVTLGNLSTKLNALKLSDVYVKECFTTDNTGVSSYSATYYLDADTGVYSTTGTGQAYYLSKSASVWLFLLYNCTEGFDANGNAISYAPDANATFANLETVVGGVQSEVENARIGQLVDAGFLGGDYNVSVRTRTLDQALAILEA